MKVLQIKSAGEMQLEAISLIGASTKRGDDSTIGMFGSGLKYAVASLLRQQIPFFVFSGNKEIKITTKSVDFGGKTFNRIFINGEQTSLTDSMGTEDWDGAFPFIREIYSNALDEDKNATIEVVDNVVPEAGFTTFYIHITPQINDLVIKFDEYFVDREKALFTNKHIGEIHTTRDGIRLYRKGILAYADRQDKSLFSYNLEHIGINESRVIRNNYEAYNEVASLLESCTDARILRRWITGLSGSNRGFYEHKCILGVWRDLANNPTLIEVILENKYFPIEMRELLDQEDKEDRLGLPSELLLRFLKYAPDVDILGMTSTSDDDKKFFVEAQASQDLIDKIIDAVSRLKATPYSSRLSAPIKTCKFLRSNILGKAHDDCIYLSVKLDTYSVDEIAKIIIEEQEHLTSGFGDETRSFQNHLFNLFYNELTRKPSHVLDGTNFNIN
jgi:hypothetical protein